MTLPRSSYTHAALAEWYARAGRQSLPWRTTSDPYAIWVSEVMLQQTQVATVRDRYYLPFLTRFPTLDALADAPLAEVLKAWEGLGYYARARNLHRAAQMAAPNFPRTVEGMMALPGVGRNTAHAVVAFAYRRNVPVVEANVKRLLHRLAAREAIGEGELWEMAAGLVDADDPFTHNQAMMDVGALICTPRAPRCGECPLALICEGKDAPLRYPARKSRKVIPVREKLIVITEDAEGRLYLTPRKTAFLGGLYGFPEYDADTREIAVDRFTLLGGIEQMYSHFRLSASVLYSPQGDSGGSEGWFTREEIGRLPLSRADHKALALWRRVAEESSR